MPETGKSATPAGAGQEEENFFTRAIARLWKNADTRRQEDAHRTASRLAGYRIAIARGERAKRFLENACWKEDVLPWLNEHSSSALTPWRPGSQDGAPFSIDQANAKYFYASGVAALASDLMGQIAVWIEDGEEAKIRLAHEEKLSGTA